MSSSSSSQRQRLTLIAQFDDICRCYEILAEGCEQDFKRFVLSQEGVRLKWLEAVNECQRMKGALESSNNEISTLNKKLRTARIMLDREKAMRRNAERDLAAIIRDYAAMDNSVTNATMRSRYSADAKLADGLNTISERDSDIRSELSYSRSDDDLDVSYGKQWKRNRPPPMASPEPVSAKRRRSSLSTNTNTNSKRTLEIHGGKESLVTTTTVTMKKGEPVTATQTMHTIPASSSSTTSLFAHPTTPAARPFPSRTKIQASAPPASDDESDFTNMNENLQNISPNIREYGAGSQINSRMHQFIQRTIMKPESCGPCGKRINFGRMALKCIDCRAIAHYDCKEQVPLPCVAMGTTPTGKGAVKGTISDFTPSIPPMVPALVIHCINEIEQRGMSEIGLYRVPGSDKEVKALKEKFMRGKGAPNLSQIKDIPVICSCLKDFLRNLSEPLIPTSMWGDFVRATEAEKTKALDEFRAILYQAIYCSLPQPNRDTLAYIILHLQRVAESPECKMPIKSLADVFGPTLVGPKIMSADASTAFKENHQASQVVELLLKVPSDFWAAIISPSATVGPYSQPTTPYNSGMRNTPSTENLMRQTVNRLFSGTPLGQRTRRKKRFFDTPPSLKKQ
nr:PREDICTED: rac GTPase-activating protein 1 [Bemisia tabaci]XP_018903750.1 PREDICTED: rac GTPase-activating protein 1 [Bemisia tabaci]